jgi:hypothetical protein
MATLALRSYSATTEDISEYSIYLGERTYEGCLPTRSLLSEIIVTQYVDNAPYNQSHRGTPLLLTNCFLTNHFVNCGMIRTSIKLFSSSNCKYLKLNKNAVLWEIA